MHSGFRLVHEARKISAGFGRQFRYDEFVVGPFKDDGNLRPPGRPHAEMRSSVGHHLGSDGVTSRFHANLDGEFRAISFWPMMSNIYVDSLMLNEETGASMPFPLVGITV
jgi:hypothetical protein